MATKTATMASSAAVADVKLVSTIIYLVNNLPRGTNKLTNKDYVGLRQDRCELTNIFFNVMSKLGHPLANVKNDNCTYDKPCHACRRDVYESAIQQAEASKQIIRQARAGKQFTDDRGRVSRGKGYVMFYRPDEFSASHVDASFIDNLMVSLKS